MPQWKLFSFAFWLSNNPLHVEGSGVIHFFPSRGSLCKRCLQCFFPARRLSSPVAHSSSTAECLVLRSQSWQTSQADNFGNPPHLVSLVYAVLVLYCSELCCDSHRSYSVTITYKLSFPLYLIKSENVIAFAYASRWVKLTAHLLSQLKWNAIGSIFTFTLQFKILTT